MWPSQATPTRAPGLSVDALARRLDPADDLVPRHDRQFGIGQLAVDDMQVGAADAAGFDREAGSGPGPGSGSGRSSIDEPLAGSPEDHGAHDRIRLQAERRDPATDRRRRAYRLPPLNAPST